MKTAEALVVARICRMWWVQTRVLPVLVVISTLIGGCVSASAPGTSGGRTQRGDLVYDVCMEVHAKSVGERMLPIVCQVVADDCRDNPGGDGCKKKLQPLDEKLKASGSSMMYAAAYAGRADVVRTMIGMGSDPNATVATGWTPLLIAAAEGHDATVATLLEAGADPNVKNQLGRTALMFASSKGFTAIAKNLLERGADVTLRDKSGNTALTLAEAQGHSTVARVLREHSSGR